MNSPPKSWQRFWWPKVDTPENAASAAKNGGVAFGFIALPYAIFALSGLFLDYPPLRQPHPHFVGFDNTMSPPGPSPVLLVIALIAARAAWRTYKRPSLLLCTLALIWVLLEFVYEPPVTIAHVWEHNWGGSPPNGEFIGVYCAQILGTVAGLGGVRGASAARRFRHSSPNGAV